MDTLRYPIGQFQPVPNPTTEERNNWIEEIALFPDTLEQTVKKLTQEQLLTPYRPGGWTIRQVVHHIADNDINAYVRFKRALTEDNPMANSYREDLWADLSDSLNTPVEHSLLLIRSLHARFAILLRSLQPPDFQRTFISPAHGLLTLDAAAQRFDWHNRHHLAQIASLKERSGW